MSLSAKRSFSAAFPLIAAKEDTGEKRTKAKRLPIRTKPLAVTGRSRTSGAKKSESLSCCQCNALHFDMAVAQECCELNATCSETLGAISKGRSHRPCPSCHPFAASPSCLKPKKSWKKNKERPLARSHLRILNNGATTNTLLRSPRRRFVKPDIEPVAILCRKSSILSTRRRETSVEKGKIPSPAAAYHTSRPHSAFEEDVRKHDTVDYKKLRGWVTDCESYHEKCRIQEKFLPPNSKVIDCNNRSVVRMPSTDAYVALSYVWGSGRSATREQFFQLDDHLPQEKDMPLLIEDAIKVVKHLGFSYLWVDQICINQSDDVERQSQIENMDMIYENAVVTIISLFGDSAEAGLPGVSEVRRITLPASNTASGKHVESSHPTLADYLERSTWATRCWTYQEAVLSRRRLFFTETQVYFSCQQLVRSEANEETVDTDAPKYASYIPLLIPKLLSRVPRIAIGNRTSGFSLVEFYAFLSEYHGCRSLTRQSDTLTAFLGVLARCSFYSLWGIPILSAQPTPDMMQQEQTSAKTLALGLNWRISPSKLTVDQLKRRPGFPTWSWTSVANQITYLISAKPSGLMDGLYFYDFETSKQQIPNAIECQARFWLEKGEHRRQPAFKTRKDTSPARIISEGSQTIFFETEVFRLSKLISQSLNGKGHVFDRQSASISKINGDGHDGEDQQQITVHLDQSRPDLQSMNGDECPQVGLVLLFRSRATNYFSYSISDRGENSGISCALVVQWRGDVTERIGTATATYDFFGEVSAQREFVQLQ
jgi:Heterokaryon incompatibility protein (HET)